MASYVYSTIEYRDPLQASLYDILIPAGYGASLFTVAIDTSSLPAERSIGLTAPLLFDEDSQQLRFSPVGFSKLLAGDQLVVSIGWRQGGEAHQATITVHGQTGDEGLPFPSSSGTDGADFFLGGLSSPIGAEAAGDVFLAGGGDDQVYGNSGFDELHGGDGADVLDGGAGIVGLVAYEGDRLYGDGGDDVLVGGGGGQGGDHLEGGDGNDLLIGSGILIGDGGDELYGGAGDDELRGLDGPDLLSGGAGFDVADYASSPAGVVVLLAKADEFGIGGSFRNFAAGGYWRAGAGEDPLAPAPAHSARDRYSSIEAVRGSDFDDLVFGAWHATTAWLGGGDDVFDNYEPSQAGERILGQEGDDAIWTGGGSDRLYGGGGYDWLFGEDGDDLLSGDFGNDYLAGGSGRDVFAYVGIDNGSDFIADFVPGTDKIDLRPEIDPAALLAARTFATDGDLLLTYALLGYETELRFDGPVTGLGIADFV